MKTQKSRRNKTGNKTAKIQATLDRPIGILGGGQLARMMALKAHEMGLKTAVFSEVAEDPAAQVTSLWKKGKLASARDLELFLRQCSVVTFESEFLDAHLLKELAKKTGTPIFPSPELMAALQDRLTQKELLLENRLPTARFHTVKTADEAHWALADLGGKAVFKKRRFGYDGYGTFIVRNEKELVRFLPHLIDNPYGFIAEELIPFARELAVMVVRSRSEQTLRLPYVESFQENARCLWVKGPLRESAKLKNLGRKLEKFLTAIDYIGAMGIEIFETKVGDLIINELAPRVHNSGHYSLDALESDQFSLHIKAILGQDIGTVSLHQPGFAMMNLLGSSEQAPSWHLPADVKLHWYGKSENRAGRKMGHINALGKTPEKALQTVLRRRSDFKV